MDNSLSVTITVTINFLKSVSHFIIIPTLENGPANLQSPLNPKAKKKIREENDGGEFRHRVCLKRKKKLFQQAKVGVSYSVSRTAGTEAGTLRGRQHSGRCRGPG